MRSRRAAGEDGALAGSTCGRPAADPSFAAAPPRGRLSVCGCSLAMLAYASDVGCTPSDRVEPIPARTCADAACVNRTAGVRCCSLAGDACSSHCYGLSRNKCRTLSCLMTLQDAIEECATQGQRLCERDEMCVAASRPRDPFPSALLLASPTHPSINWHASAQVAPLLRRWLVGLRSRQVPYMGDAANAAAAVAATRSCHRLRHSMARY